MHHLDYIGKFSDPLFISNKSLRQFLSFIFEVGCSAAQIIELAEQISDFFSHSQRDLVIRLVYEFLGRSHRLSFDPTKLNSVGFPELV